VDRERGQALVGAEEHHVPRGTRQLGRRRVQRPEQLGWQQRRQAIRRQKRQRQDECEGYRLAQPDEDGGFGAAVADTVGYAVLPGVSQPVAE